MSCLFPKAQSLDDYWSNLKRGVDAITEVPASHWSPDEFFDEDPKRPDHVYAKRGGFLDPVEFDPTEYGIAPSNLEATDSAQLLSLVVAQGAMVDAGYGPNRDFDRSRISCILGVTGTLQLAIALGGRLGHPIWRKALLEGGIDPAKADEIVRSIGDSYVVWQENSFPGLLGNVVAGRIANRFNLGGTNCVVDAACASSVSAIHLAALELQTGKADMVLTGGADAFNDIFMYMCFSKTPALSPTGDARPFAADADGTILGEGVGMIALKRLADAERDGDNIYGIIRGIGTSSDGRGKAIYAPSAEGQERALLSAYRAAGVSPATIGMVEAHGTGTKVGDAVEVSALKKVYREAQKTGTWCALGSVKSQIGHTKAAAGVAGLIKALLALKHKVLPPTIKVNSPNPGIDQNDTPFYINTEKRPWLSRPDHPRRAGVSAFGFGGSNFHMVVEEAEPQKNQIDWDGRVQIVALSADTHAELKSKLQEIWPAGLAWKQACQRFAATRRTFKVTQPWRLVFVVEREKSESTKLIDAILKRLDADGDKMHWAMPEGVFFNRSPKPGLLAFLIPGQGSQYVGMARDLACLFPKMQEVLLQADMAYGDMADLACQLSDFIFPHATFSEEARRLNELALRATHIAQPAIGAVGMGMICVLSMFGVHPAMAAGHSFGELVALFAGGKISAEDFHRLAKLRGELMGAAAGDQAGAMLAVQASFAEVERAISEDSLEVVVANKNSPNQFVLSGTAEAIDRAAAAFRVRKISCTGLPVAAAFHSPLVARAAEPFREALDTVEIKPGEAVVYANTTAEPYPEDAAAARDLLGSQLACPVEFAAEIEAMYAAGAHTFLEVGPGARMTSLVRSILGQREFHALTIDASSGRNDGSFDLACALAQLAAIGHPVDLAQWAPEPEAAPSSAKPRMTVSLTGAPYRNPAARISPAKANATPKTQGSGGHAPAPAAFPPQPPTVPVVAAARTISPSAPPKEAPRMSIPVPPPNPSSVLGGARPAADPRPFDSPPISPTASHSSTFTTSTPSSPASALPAGNPVVLEAFRAAQENLAAIQRLQAQTAELHRQFLQGQEAAMRTFGDLMARQQACFQQAMGMPASAPPPVAPSAYIQPVAPPAPSVSIPFVSAPVPQPVARPVAPIAAVAAAPVSTSPSAPAPKADRSLAPVLLEIVSEKTGYPAETLSLDMDLESDLGIDSIKRVEIMSGLQERMPSLPAVQPDQMGSLRTLRQIIDFLGENEAAEPPAAASSSNGHSSNGHSSLAGLESTLLEIVSEKTGYPAETLSLEMDLESDLGIDSIKRVEIMSGLQERVPSLPAVQPEQMGSLRTLGQIIAFLGASAPAPTNTKVVAASSSNGSADSARLQAALIAAVSEKTGYPAETLQLDMDLEGDLGIDSIKRVEILSAMQERFPEAPTAAPEELGKFRTLGQIIEFLAGASGAARAIPAAPVAANGNGNGHANGHSNGNGAHRANGSNGHAAPHAPLRRATISAAPLDGSRRERVRLAAGSEIWIAGDQGPASAAFAAALDAVGFRGSMLSIIDASSAAPPPALAGLIIVAPVRQLAEGGLWGEASEDFVKSAFAAMKNAAPALRRAGKERGGAIFATVSRLDGAFGLADGASAFDPVMGALAGLAKSAAREWPEVSCKALDAAPDLDDAALVAALVEETHAVGPAEVGIHASGRVEIAESELNDSAEGDPISLSSGAAIVVSGGARGVTAEAALALAERFGASVVLLGRSPAPEPEPDWLAGLESEAEIKRAILAKGNGHPLTPKEVEREWRRWMANREILQTERRIEAAGGRAFYRSLDTRDESAVRGALAAVRSEIGPIEGIVHGAGVLADRLIEEKTPEQFAQVFDTKVAGLRALLSAAAEDDLKFLALFSSVSGRYGRRGQCDYSAANEALNKIARREGARRPACRVVAVNWGPWDGGMVGPGLKKVFESEGVGLIPLREGARWLADELASARRDAEVVLSIGGGLAPAAPKASALAVAFERELDLDRSPFLRSHVINGRAVLPVAMIVEWLAHGALHENPGLAFCGFDGLRVFKGVKIGEGETVALRVGAAKAKPSGDMLVALAELIGGGADRPVLHARAEIVLGPSQPKPAAAPRLEIAREAYARPLDSVYQDVLFHGEALRGMERIDSLSDGGGVAKLAVAPRPSQWIQEPLRGAWIADPLALDAALQLGVLWCAERGTGPGLPAAIASYRQFARAFPKDGTLCRMKAERGAGSIVHFAYEFVDASGAVVASASGADFVMDPSLRDAFRRNSVPAAVAS